MVSILSVAVVNFVPGRRVASTSQSLWVDSEFLLCNALFHVAIKLGGY